MAGRVPLGADLRLCFLLNCSERAQEEGEVGRQGAAAWSEFEMEMNRLPTNQVCEKPKVLLIDDDRPWCEAFIKGLSRRGYIPSCAFTMEDGLARAVSEHPDLIISDIRLDDGDGFRMLSSLADERTTEGIPIILISGAGVPEYLEQAINLGAADYLAKPFSLNRLEETINKLLVRRKRREDWVRAGRAQITAIMEMNPDLVTTADAQYHEVLHVNRMGRAFFDLNPNEGDAPIPTHLIHPPWALELILKEGVPAAIRDGRWVGETACLRGDGAEVPFSQMLLAHSDANGRVEYLTSIARDITACKQAEASLKESRQLLEQVLNAIPLRVFWKDRDSVYLGCNRMFAADAGVASPDEVIGRTDSDLAWSKSCDECVAADREVILSEQPLLHCEAEHIKPDGTSMLMRLSKVPLKNARDEVIGVLGTYEDITQLKEAEAKVEHSSNLLRTLLEHSTDYIYFKDRESRFVVCSRAKVRKHIPDGGIYDLKGKTDFDVFGDEHAREAFEDEQNILRTGEGLVGKLERETNTDGSITWVLTTKLPWRDAAGEMVGSFGISRDVTDLQRTLELMRIQEAALRAAGNSVVITDRDGRILWVNPAFTRTTGYALEEVMGQNPRLLKSDEHDGEFYDAMWHRLCEGECWQGEITNRRKDGSLFTEDTLITPIRDQHGFVTHFVAVKQDITARKEAQRQRDMMEVQIRHSQKLESMGRLAAGIAHEINTPTQYVGDNVRFLQDAFADFSKLNAAFNRLLDATRQHGVAPELVSEIEQTIVDTDLEYLTEEIPQSISQALEGVERVTKIVRAMKEFSHPGSNEKTPVDLNRTIESTLTVSRNEWKYNADLVTNLDPDLPLVPCLPDEFNQVILNLAVNAAHAIAATGRTEKGTLTVSTRRDGDQVEVRIQDTGTGIPVEARSRIFEPFFTTKEVGKGTGQGLAIARSVIVEKHGGTIHFETEMGKGTTFIIRLPIKSEKDKVEA